ncbi:MAG: dihydrolipoamide acetyltransferase family protein [Ilumatobacteraceae bacterium]
MSRHTVRLPDVGEGVAEAELVSWQVQVGDLVTPESVLAEVMTDKATVEISSPVAGTVSELFGEPGEVLAVGSAFVAIELDDGAPAPSPATTPGPTEAVHVAGGPPSPAVELRHEPGPRAGAGAKPTAAPAVRARAKALGIDLAIVAGSGPDGRVLHADLDAQLSKGAPRRSTAPAARPTVASPAGGETVSVRGLRRRIAERLTRSWTEIPHITYVEAVDATELEALRAELNARRTDGARLTILPFVVRALVIACGEQPRLNAHYDGDAQLLTTFDTVHVGIATQTPDGLTVPVVHDAGALGVWEIAAEIARLANAARDGKATVQELTGSTITITSLGALGGLVTTPIINQPEVAIVGVNKLETRPVWRGDRFEPRQVCNLSSSFDHRIVDGWDAATFIQRVKALLEMPALLFVDD